MRFHELNNELLIAIAGHLPQDDLKTFSHVCHKFALVAHSDVVWKERLYNHYGITYKLPTENWKDMYARKSLDPQNSKMCPHIGHVTGKILEPYATKYQQVLNWLEKNLNCTGNTRNRCKDCAYSYHKAVEGHGILIRMNVLQMYCFDCKRLLGETRGDSSEAHYVNLLLKTLTHDSKKGQEAMARRSQCMEERQLYAEHADRASVVSDGKKYYFIERIWLISWFLRLCDGKIGTGPIANHELEDPEHEGKLNPASRPRGNFKGGFSIVTPFLWNYLVETYGLSGQAYTSDDTTGPEYCGLNEAIVNWRLN
ncbi:hypothetical protein PS6_007489 [Mucor atramentarius]